MFKKLLVFIAAMYVAVSFAAVDVNKATAAELDGLKGIGPGISGKIVEERKKGNFKDWNDFITRVQGVGETNAAKFSAEGMTVGGASFKGVAAAPAAAAAKKDDKPAAAAKKDDKPMAKADAKPAAAVAAAPAAAAAAKDEKKDPKAEAKAKKEADKQAKADAKKKKADDAKAKADAAKAAKTAKADTAKPAATTDASTAKK